MWILFAVIGYNIGDRKGLGALGAVLGLVLGIFGVLIIAVIPAKDKPKAE